MILSSLNIAVIVFYFLLTIFIGLYFTWMASKNISAYFLGGRRLPWYVLSVSNASGMFDVSGTMWLLALSGTYLLSLCLYTLLYRICYRFRPPSSWLLSVKPIMKNLACTFRMWYSQQVVTLKAMYCMYITVLAIPPLPGLRSMLMNYWHLWNN